MRDELNHPEQDSINVMEYEVYFYDLSRYFYANTATAFENIQKLVKGLNISLQLSTTQMVVYGHYFGVL